MNAMQKKLGKICTFDCQMKQHEIIVTLHSGATALAHEPASNHVRMPSSPAAAYPSYCIWGVC